MLLDLESDTVSTFMMCFSTLFIVFGYFAYRLICKVVDHMTHTQQVDQYARHFTDNKHLLTSFGQNVFQYLVDVEKHFYNYTLYTFFTNAASRLVSKGCSKLCDYTLYTFFTNTASRLVSKGCSQLCDLVWKNYNTCTPSPQPVFRPVCNPMPLYGDVNFDVPAIARYQPTCADQRNSCPRKEEPVCPNTKPTVDGYYGRLADIIKMYSDNTPTLKSLDLQNICHVVGPLIKNNILEELDHDAGATVLFNKYANEILSYKFNINDSNSLVDCVNKYSNFLANISPEEKNHWKVVLDAYKTNPSKCHPFKEFLLFFDDVKNGKPVTFREYFCIFRRLVTKIVNLPADSIPELRDADIASWDPYFKIFISSLQNK